VSPFPPLDESGSNLYDRVTMRKSVLYILIAIAVAAIVGPSIYFYSKYSHAEFLRKNPTEAAKEEQKQVLDKVAKLTELPSGESPTIATISDREKLAGQPFFANAINGDKVIFYPTSKRAIIYRPSTNKIIDMSQVNVTESVSPTPLAVQTGTVQQPTPTTQQPTNLRVAIYNGTTTPKLANTVEKAVTESMAYVTVTTKDNAKNQDYNQSIVVDLTGARGEQAKTLATLVNGNVAAFPSGETRPDADILIIIGKSYK
jgi:hypothetical protein